MAPQELDDETLGAKHRNYNQKLRDTRHILDDNDDTDINYLLKIDKACQNKDVDFILNLLKSDDMLYVSKVISGSSWLVSDKSYVNIINPDYLQAELFPKMTTKAIIKFKKHIRHNIKEESSAEQFYVNEKDKVEASKWLPHCSIPFIEKHVEKHISTPLKLRLFKRLCEKSVTIFEVILKKLENYEKREYLQAVTFILKTNVDLYLDCLENSNRIYPKLNRKATELIMKHSKNRVTNKMEAYISVIDIPTFVRYLKVEDIKEFLYAQAKRDIQTYEYRNLRRLFQYDTLKHFIYRLPKNEQFDFVKEICLRGGNEVLEKDILSTDSAICRLKKICNRYNQKNYVWYQFAPFDHAFDEITKLISQNVEPYEKSALLSVLIKCTNHNLEHIQTLLQYYINKHKKEDDSTQLNFVTELIKYMCVSKCDEKTWNILNSLLKSLKIYEQSSDAVNRDIRHFIIIYNVINDHKPDEVIEKQFTFETFPSERAKMNEVEQNKLFYYLYERVNSKLNSPITNEDNFTESISTFENMLTLLKHWDKNLVDYPTILNKIKELIKLKKENKWKGKFSNIYNINKSWRKHMFEESVDLHPSEEVCLNALKHGPLLLLRHKEEVDTLRKEDSVCFQRVLAKLRVYWPHTIAQEWNNNYLKNIDETQGQKAAIRGICSISPPKPLLDVIDKYKPIEPKIDWKQTDDRIVKIQGLLAKNMHRARPQPPPDSILSYAKGDYLQYALPSVLAIFYNMKFENALIYIPKLLDAPVSLQKHGIRFAFKRLQREELKKVFLNCWNTSKNASIRAIIFKYTHMLLCNEKDDTKAASLWELLDIFIDNLNFAEDKEIYKLFDQVQQIPLNVRANYIIRSYNFLQKLIEKVPESDRSQYQWICSELAKNSRVVMETISSDFVITIIQEFIDKKLFDSNSKTVSPIHYSDGIVKVLSAYLLCSKNENDQIQKYEQVFVPLMHRSFEKWGDKSNGNYIIRQNFDQILSCFTFDLKDYVSEKKLLIPLKMFSLIMVELENTLLVAENYMILTKWKLAVALAKLQQDYSTAEKGNIIPVEFGKICLEQLKTDVALHFPCIYVLFAKCVQNIMFSSNLLESDDAKLEFYAGLLSDDFIQGYLAAIEIGSDYNTDKKYENIWKKVASHASIEVKMHYCNKIEEKKI